MVAAIPVGHLLRDWRLLRRLSQLELACEAEISTRHLSFIETGRSVPSREMLLHLAEQLGVPLRVRNLLLHAAGYAPVFQERPLQDPALSAARKACDAVLEGHKPYPAFAIDRHWNIVASNNALAPFLGDVEPWLLQNPVNALRLSLHPRGLAPRIANLAEWRAHLLNRLRQQIDSTADPMLMDLMKELRGYNLAPGVAAGNSTHSSYAGVVVPLEFVTDAGLLSLISTVTVFGTPVDITVSELALECFYPANAETAQILRDTAAAQAAQ